MLLFVKMFEDSIEVNAQLDNRKREKNRGITDTSMLRLNRRKLR